jgi:tripartite-type tricarboxylate transporter receptor subunit TctC
MKQLYAVLVTLVVQALAVNVVMATEVIRIYSPYSAGHSGTPAMRRIIEQANTNQKIYTFVLEFRPGGNQAIAVKSITPENSLAIIAPAYVDNTATGLLREQDYRPIHSLGTACWAVVTNKPLAGQKEFVVGGVGRGNAAHLTGLALGDKYKFDVRYVLFKSNYDALVNMAGNNGIEMVIDKYEGYESLRTRNPQLNMVAASCTTRLPQAPSIKTLKQLGIDAPYIFNITVAHRDMNPTRRQAIGMILNYATQQVGADEIYRLSAMRPPMFDGISDEAFYTQSVQSVQKLQARYRDRLGAE